MDQNLQALIDILGQTPFVIAVYMIMRGQNDILREIIKERDETIKDYRAREGRWMELLMQRRIDEPLPAPANGAGD